jgi:hypothetical protein
MNFVLSTGGVPLTVTVVLCVADPAPPTQVSAYVVVCVGVTDSEPEIDFPPVHPPLAVQEVELSDTHASDALCPAVTLEERAIKVSVTGGVTTGRGCTSVVVTFRVTDPPSPTQVSAYVVVCVGVIDSEPEIAFPPVHPPLAVQAVAFKADQVIVTR